MYCGGNYQHLDEPAASIFRMTTQCSKRLHRHCHQNLLSLTLWTIF